VPADPAAITSALDRLGRMPVYLHLDVDVIDSAQLPGLRFPSGPGPAVTQIEECLSAVCASADVRAACIACAWLPDRISDQTTREAITPARQSTQAPTWLGTNPPVADRSAGHPPLSRAGSICLDRSVTTWSGRPKAAAFLWRAVLLRNDPEPEAWRRCCGCGC